MNFPNFQNFNLDSVLSADPRTVLGNELQTVYNQNSDELWISAWLQQNGLYNQIPALTKPKPSMPINQVKSSMKDCLLILEKLTCTQKDLQDNVETMSSTEWKQKTIEIGMLKDELTKIIAKFENPKSWNAIKNKVMKRKLKRLKEKERKQRRKDQLNQDLEKRQKLHKDIDLWLQGMKEEVERAKAEETFKKDADCVLAEVNKKKSDARKQLALIKSLVKLRIVRESFAAQRGETTSAEDRKAFNVATEKLIQIWETSLSAYSEEEQKLSQMLEKTAVEDSKAQQLEKERKLLEEWRKVLFGPFFAVPYDNPTYWALTAAERDVETFVAIRKSWDTFLVSETSEGSRIPIGWVLPEITATEQWMQYLEH